MNFSKIYFEYLPGQKLLFFKYLIKDPVTKHSRSFLTKQNSKFFRIFPTDFPPKIVFCLRKEFKGHPNFTDFGETEDYVTLFINFFNHGFLRIFRRKI